MKPDVHESLMSELRSNLREVFALHGNGAGHELIRARGLVDGYMRALLTSGLATREELLTVVVEERTLARGPALREAFANENWAAARATGSAAELGTL